MGKSPGQVCGTENKILRMIEYIYTQNFHEQIIQLKKENDSQI